MTKASKKMGITQTKYKEVESNNKHVKSGTKKRYLLVIPEREMTASEIHDMKYNETRGGYYPDFCRAWKRRVVGKYATIKDATKARQCYIQHNTFRLPWSMYAEIERSVLEDQQEKIVIRFDDNGDAIIEED